MDGWETRRRRGADGEHPFPAEDEHDWALIRLAAPGVIRGIIVDTAHFRGNYPQQVTVEATALPGSPGPEELLADDVKWEELVPRTPVRGHAANGFEVTVERRFTHLRLKQHPDGGIARLRVHGEVVPDPEWLDVLGTLDLASVLHGGTVEDASDRFYSSPTQIIQPDLSRKMDDGWENRRRRVKGTNDWVRFRLAAQGEIRAVEIDTAYLKGNSAGWAALTAATPATRPTTPRGSRSCRRPSSSPTPRTASSCPGRHRHPRTARRLPRRRPRPDAGARQPHRRRAAPNSAAASTSSTADPRRAFRRAP